MNDFVDEKYIIIKSNEVYFIFFISWSQNFTGKQLPVLLVE